MTKLPIYLLLALAAQLLLAAALYWSGNTDGSREKPLLDLSGEVDKLVISDGKQQTTLLHGSGGWTIPQLDGLPADGKRIDAALERLTGLRVGFPVTETESAHDRFEVGEDHFQRRLELYTGNDSQATILLGSSPGFRQVHLRVANENEIYAVELNVFDYPADPQQWLDKEQLALPSPRRIESKDYVLELEGGEWVVQGGAAVDQDKARELASAFGSLQISGRGEALAGDKVEEVEFKVSAADITASYLFQSDGTDYRVSRSDRKGVFSISQYEYGRIAEVALRDLLAKGAGKSGDSGEPEEPEEPGDPEESRDNVPESGPDATGGPGRQGGGKR